MTAKELASILDGKEYGCDIMDAVHKEAADNGLVIVCAGYTLYGEPEDMTGFEGAWSEIIHFGSGPIYITPKGPFAQTGDEIVYGAPRWPYTHLQRDASCPYTQGELSKFPTIRIVGNVGDGQKWTYHTDIPHEVFDTFDNGKPFHRGIVFAVADVREKE